MKMDVTAPWCYLSNTSLQSTCAVMVSLTQKSASFISAFIEKLHIMYVLCTLKLIKTRIPFDNRLSGYRLTSMKIML